MAYAPLNGDEVPVVGIGTWQLAEDVAYRSVATALELGYRHVDTAQAYGNEAGVGRAIAEAAVERESVFLTTKVRPTHRSVDAIVASVERSLERLDTSYVDLILIHWPHPLAKLPNVMAGLDEVVDRGHARHLGVSNFGIGRLEKARRYAENPVVTDQVLLHPHWPQRDLRAYCGREGVVVTAYSPLGNGALVGDRLLASIGERYGKSAAQVALRWAVQHDGVVAIPQSTSRAHLAENLDVLDFVLTDEELERITRPSYLRTGLAAVRGLLGV